MEEHDRKERATRVNRIQQRDIAIAAGVSPSTVSRVLNNFDNISEEVRERVLQVATSMGFQQRANKFETINLFINNLGSNRSHDVFHTDIMISMERECQKHNIRFSPAVIEIGSNSHKFVVERMRQHSADGFIFMALDDRKMVEKALTLNSRVIVVNNEFSHLPVDTIMPDNYEAAQDAVRYLIECGHRSILHTTAHGSRNVRARLHAYQSVLAENNIPFDPKMVLDTTLGRENAYRRMKEFLAADPPPFTAIFSVNDSSAAGCLRALKEVGMRIPEDVSIIGYDDTEAATLVEPALTTVRIERDEIGKLAIRRLLDRVAEPDLIPIRIQVLSRLIIRQSVAKIHHK